MNTKPIIIVSAEPYSVFLEIFFKAIRLKNTKKKIILIASHDLVEAQMRSLNFNFKINLIDIKKMSLKHLRKDRINLIDINFKFKKPFDKISKNLILISKIVLKLP